MFQIVLVLETNEMCKKDNDKMGNIIFSTSHK